MRPGQTFKPKQERAQKLTALLEKTRVSGEMLEKIERAQQERLAVQASVRSRLDDADESQRGLWYRRFCQPNGGNLASALGSTLAQLLKRPEIVVEDLAVVVRESYSEYFAEIGLLTQTERSPREDTETRRNQSSPPPRHAMK